jgi:formamidopyrimidine-DNA glycosylase
MPELPEVEITARRLDAALRGATIESAQAPGINALKTFDPPLSALAGRTIEGVGRRGKQLVVQISGGLVIHVHLMSAGRLQLYDKRAGPRDRTSRLLVRIDDGRELRLREFGTRQAAWVKLLRAEELEDDEMLKTLGPEAWPAPEPDEFARLIDQPRHLHPLLRDQRTIAGIGRSWVDELLWAARLSPFQKGSELEPPAIEALHAACDEVLGGALEHYEQVIGDTVPDKLPMPLQVHRRAGEECPRCGARIEAIHFKDYVMCYCPEEQTGGRILKDRRLSKLLK